MSKLARVSYTLDVDPTSYDFRLHLPGNVLKGQILGRQHRAEANSIMRDDGTLAGDGGGRILLRSADFVRGGRERLDALVEGILAECREHPERSGIETHVVR